MNVVVCDFCGKVIRVNGIDQPVCGYRDHAFTACEVCLDDIEKAFTEIQSSKRPNVLEAIPFEPGEDLGGSVEEVTE